MHVDSTRAICSAVAKGDVDIAIIGGEVPEELRDVLQASMGVLRRVLQGPWGLHGAAVQLLLSLLSPSAWGCGFAVLSGTWCVAVHSA